MIKFTILALFAAIGASGVRAAEAPAAPGAAPSAMGPQEVVENSARRMLQELDKNRQTYRSDPAKLDGLVANVLLPNFDTEYAARLWSISPPIASRSCLTGGIPTMRWPPCAPK